MWHSVALDTLGVSTNRVHITIDEMDITFYIDLSNFLDVSYGWVALHSVGLGTTNVRKGWGDHIVYSVPVLIGAHCWRMGTKAGRVSWHPFAH